MENYRIIASQIVDIRFILNNIGLEKPDDKPILKALENLATFVIKNFEIPPSHKKYIHINLGVDESSLNLIEDLINNNSKITKHFSIEFQLRAIEAYFSFGRPKEIESEKLITLKYLIAKLHGLVGDKAVRYPL